MKVRELIELLAKHNGDAPVLIVHGMHTRDVKSAGPAPAEDWVPNDEAFEIVSGNEGRMTTTARGPVLSTDLYSFHTRELSDLISGRLSGPIMDAVQVAAGAIEVFVQSAYVDGLRDGFAQGVASATHDDDRVRAEALREALEQVRDQREGLTFYIARDALAADDAARGPA